MGNQQNQRIGRPTPPSLKGRATVVNHKKEKIVWPWIVGGSIVLSALVFVLVWRLLVSQDSSVSVQDVEINEPSSEVSVPVSTRKVSHDMDIAYDTIEEQPVVAKKVEKYPQLGLSQGSNTLRGNMIYGEKRFPFTLTFNYDCGTGKISNCVYHNVGYKTTIRMSNCYVSGNSLDFYGKDGSNNFSINISKTGTGRYEGSSTSGSQTLDVEMWND